MVNLVLGDDHGIFVDALAAALPRWGFTMVGNAGTIEATMTTVARNRPDVCLLDRYFPDGDGINAIAETMSVSATTKVVILTADGDVRGMRQAIGNGAVGYVNKTCGLSVLATAIERVMEGEIVVELAAAKATRPAGTTEALRLMSRLTARERECLGLLVAGAHTATMAKRLGVSRTTVRTHVQSILTKLGVHSRLEAAAFVSRYSLLDDADEALIRARGDVPG